jgi:hypothetical protein
MADSDGWMTDGSCGEGWVEPPDCDDMLSGYFTPDLSSDSDVEEDLSYGDGRRARTSMFTPPVSPAKSPSTTPPPFSLYHEVLGIPQPAPERKRPRSLSATSDTAVFTPRCVLQRTIQRQKEAVGAAVTISDKQWDAYANMLSPPTCKPPRCPNPPLVRPTCRFDLPCLCIACAGVHTKPSTASCVVCAAIIPYSVCNKIAVATTPPSMCFACCSAFGES